MYNKKAAMFGLDARIALAIFGALSVISGAALYSAIQESKVVALNVELKEAAKAFEQYYLDVGSVFPLRSGSTMFLKSGNIAVNYEGESNWKGPYLPYSSSSANNMNFEKYHEGGIMFFSILSNNDSSWGDSSVIGDTLTAGSCSSGKTCAAWLNVQVKDLSLITKLDIAVDGSENASEGTIKVIKTSSSYNVYYKVMPIDNPND